MELRNRDRPSRPEQRPKRIALLAGIVFISALILSLIHGAPDSLPSAALDWPLLLHIIRASIVAGLVGAGALIVVRLWAGELPTKLSTTGAEWATPLQAPDRDVQDQLLKVARESKDAMEALRESLTPEKPGPFDDALERLEAELHEAERRDALADAVASLPEGEKLVIALGHWEGLSNSEIAEVLDVTQAHVARLNERARDHLRRYLGREPFDDPPPA